MPLKVLSLKLNTVVRMSNDPSPLHELIFHVLSSEESKLQRSTNLLPLGTMQALNQRLMHQPLLDFINATLRGISQVIFVNNPVSGLLFLIAMFTQTPWLGTMSLLGTASATLTAILLQKHANIFKLDRHDIQNGILGLNGLLTGATIASLGLFGNGTWNLNWAIAVIVFASFSTLLMQTVGVWFASKFRVAPLGIPFHMAVLSFVILVLFLPQTFFVGSLPLTPPSQFNGLQLAQSLPKSIGQVFFSDNYLVGILVVLGIAICSPISAIVGLLGCLMYLLAGLLLQVTPNDLYTGLWGYNAVLTSIAIGGVFYTPNLLSIFIELGCAFLASLFSWGLAALFAPLKLPVMALPFVIVTIGCFIILRRSLPSLVPVALHTVASPEEHRQRFLVAKRVISNFRRQLTAAIQRQPRQLLFKQASPDIKGNLRYIFDAIDIDRNGQLSVEELTSHLNQAGKGLSNSEIMLLFRSMDSDCSNTIDFEEFGELMLRHRQLMAEYNEFITYFLPIDADEDNTISVHEMNIAMASVGELPLTKDEITFLRDRTGGQLLTWNQFIEMLLLI